MLKQIFKNDELRNIFNTFGIEYKISGDWLLIVCPFHDDTDPSCAVNSLSGIYHCFACGSKGKYDKLFSELNIDIVIDDVDFVDSSKLKRFIVDNDDEFIIHNDYNFKQLYGCKINKKTNKYVKYIKMRKIGNKTVKKLKIGYINGDKRYSNRIVFPIYDYDGKNILWYESRSIYKNMKPKYWRPKNVKSKDILYNIHNCNNNYVIVVEGVFGVAHIVDIGYDCVCTFGASFSNKQLNLLMKFDDVYFMFDSDEAGNSAKRKIVEVCNNYGFNTYIVPMPVVNGIDIDNLKHSELKKLIGLSNRKNNILK